MISWFFFGDPELGPVAVDLEAAQQRLRQVEAERRGQPRVEAREGVVRGAARRVPADVQRRAGRAAAARSRRCRRTSGWSACPRRPTGSCRAPGRCCGTACCRSAAAATRPRATSTSFSAICGLMRSTCTSRFCSRATCTASSMVSRRVGPPPFCSWIGAACEAGVVAVPCPAGVGAGGHGLRRGGRDGRGAWRGAGWTGCRRAGAGCAGCGLGRARAGPGAGGAGAGCAGAGAPCPNPDAGTAAITSATSAARTRSPWWEWREAPRRARRPAGKARRANLLGISER